MKNFFKGKIHIYIDCYYYFIAGIAQLVEQWIEDPRVTSSNLVLGIIKSLIA